MDHDDFQGTPGNHDGASTDAALEARIVAWVLGEASAFEVAELERLAAAQPELALFKRRMEAVHGLLGAAAQVKKTDTLHLAPERRAKVLAAIGAAPATATGDTPGPSVIEPAASRRRSLGPGWKSLRLYFGVTAACMLVFVVVQQISVLHVARSPGSHLTLMESRSLEMPLMDEREDRVSAVEEAKSQIETRKNESARRKAEYEAELVKRQVDLVRAEVELRAASEDESELSVLAMEPNEWAASYAAGGIAVPVNRSIGTGRISHSPAPPASGDFSEPETVPAGGDDQRVEMPLYEVKESTSAGSYRATATLAGSRMTTDLRDVGSAITVVSADAFGDVSGGNARAASSYKYSPEFGASASSTSTQDRPADVTWGVGFGDTAAPDPSSVPLSVVTSQFLQDTGATNNEQILQYTTATEVAGGPQGTFVGELQGDVAPRSRELSVRGRPAAKPAPPSVHFGFGSPAGVADRDGQSINLAQDPFAPAPPMAKEKAASRETDKKLARRAPPPAKPAAIDEAHAAREPVSTFSLHVSDASFKLAQAALARGQLPEAASIRPEEFYNAFDYGDPSPALGQKVACRIEQAAHPFLQQRTLVRIAMKVANTGRGAGQPLRLTVLLDTSGSMEREDRAASVRRAIEVLAALLGPDDRVTLIGFARQPHLLAEAVRGDEARRLVDLVARTPADGGTNMEEALRLADELAQRHFAAAAQNRIVLLTDGAANLGNADPDQLATRIEALRGRGIAFDACGVGTDGLDDEILEALTRRGDGRYYVLDTPEEADAGFARQLAGAFRPAAKNVKVQVRFNPARVGAYRLLGFEKHRLREEDFRNDRVDAAELAAEEAAVAVYQVEVLPQGEGELGDVFVRFRDMASGEMVERSWTIAHDSRVRAFDQASPALQLAGASALLAEVLRGGALGDQVDLGALAPVVKSLRTHFASQPRVQELVTMFEQARRITNR